MTAPIELDTPRKKRGVRTRLTVAFAAAAAADLGIDVVMDAVESNLGSLPWWIEIPARAAESIAFIVYMWAVVPTGDPT